mmetsp:Transcript_22672/g.89691  ORF Transcript_22672/g.89691 Transcript_22672/m.89691 type:complete len:278 (+) Transcript_22672:50-883(+)|eukprot:CAMPEP_0114633458 /NCGR_PEP_ID=MMETSP0168-20121206/15465_1 /TAXON_ID=95228 ORGANISM="Vannella sp., Strain DIVA3 517/6/12" /NCGR_SAMPLE_ID=MMETSP0168 /ASSEMBLY_ACC=CAM_ASM_000044 /LENGTH=277 /DNA_ID=CAMNT_0001845109 /DNA_START=44 /DNA_END=877 /DNA_ORIENTATION=+
MAAPGSPYYPLPKRKPKKLRGRVSELSEDQVRHKSNSTSTLYVNSTVSQPDIDQLLRCVALKLYHHIQDGQSTAEKVYFDIFDERIHPIANDDPDLTIAPETDAVYTFINTIFKTERLSAECAIMMLAYIERIRTSAKVTMDSTNWRRVLLSTLILASKVWEDQAVWNVDFLSVFPNVDVKDLGQLEKVLLRLIQYNVSLSASVYANYYFELRSLAEENEETLPLRPLDKEGAKRLETRSQTEEDKAKERFADEKMSRSKSLNEMDGSLKSPPVILN